MSCYISALCITFPCPKKWTGMGRGLSRRLAHPSRPFNAPKTPQIHHWGRTLRRKRLSCHHPASPKSEERSYRCWRNRTCEENPVGGTAYLSGCGGVLGESDHRSEDGSARHIQSMLQAEPRSNACSPQKGFNIQVIASELILTAKEVCIYFFLFFFVTCHLVKVASISLMKCIYELCLVQREGGRGGEGKGCQRLSLTNSVAKEEYLFSLFHGNIILAHCAFVSWEVLLQQIVFKKKKKSKCFRLIWNVKFTVKPFVGLGGTCFCVVWKPMH